MPDLVVDPLRDLSPPPIQKDQIESIIKNLEVRDKFQGKLIQHSKKLQGVNRNLIEIYKEFNEEIRPQ